MKTWILEKLWFSPNGLLIKTRCYALASRQLAYRAMYEDYTVTWGDNDGEKNADPAYDTGSPFSSDEDSMIVWKDGSQVAWRIHEVFMEQSEEDYDRLVAKHEDDAFFEETSKLGIE